MLKSVLALIVCFTVFGPALTIPAIEAEETTEPQFSMTISYSYLMAKNGTFENLTGPDFFDHNQSLVESCALSLVLNYSLNDYPENQTIGAVTEYYKIVVESVEKSIITQMSELTAIAKNDLFKERVREFNRNSRDDHFSTALMGGGGIMIENWTVGEFHLVPTISVQTETIGYRTEAAKARRAENVTITVSYLGRVTFTDNTAEIVTATNQIVQQIQLEKHDEGWLYNNFILENELPQTNLLKPMPNMEPEIIPEFTTGTVFFGILAVMLIVIITKKKLKPR